MPLYEYECENKDCKIKEFEKLVKDLEEGQDINCPACGLKAKKKVSSFGFVLKGSGFHDVDYPTVDKAVGRDAEARWKKIRENQEEKQKFKKEKKVEHLSRDQVGDYHPTDKELYKIKYKDENS